MKTAILFSVVLAVSLATCLPARATMETSPGGIAWVDVDASKEIDAEFAKARQERKPVLLYWGAAWCPPCNQLKATLFVRQDFIALSRAVHAVHLDGDLPGAQQLGQQFKVVGYPTLILFSPDGVELTRLPGEADPIRIIESLQSALASGRSTRAILDDALTGKRLSASEWQALAFYSWDTDESQLASDGHVGELLATLAGKSAQGGADADVATRLWLKSISVYGDKHPTPAMKKNPEMRRRLMGILADARQVRAHSDIIISAATDLVRALTPAGSAERTELSSAINTALLRLQADPQLSHADQTDALIARVGLARIDIAESTLRVKLPTPLLGEARAHTARMDKEITNGYERQAVIPSCGYLLRFAGLPEESNALLTANLKKSHSPYYLMSQLADNAAHMGRSAEALNWHEQAYRESKGPATRLQWGANYVVSLFDLAPTDVKRIERAVDEVLADAAKDSGAFYDRSSRSLKKIATRIAKWDQQAARDRLHDRFAALCGTLPVADPQRKTCDGLWPTT